MKALLAIVVILAALPVPKVGSCPAGYTESGGYCAPMRAGERPAIPKRGPCPSDWITSGNYCLGPKR